MAFLNFFPIVNRIICKQTVTFHNVVSDLGLQSLPMPYEKDEMLIWIKLRLL